MKKIYLISAVFLFAMQTMAQKYFDVYQNGVVKNSIASSSLDSIGLTGSTEQDRMVVFYKGEIIVNSYLASSVDSIKVKNTFTLYAPTNVTATYDEDANEVTVTWNPVTYAECYDVYRNGELLAENITSTSYIDNSPGEGNITYCVRARRGELESDNSESVIVEINVNKLLKITVNGVEFTMIKVSGGTFQMGATTEQGSDAGSDERPVHQVTLSDYFIGETEVTQELWQAVMGGNPSYFKTSNQLPVEQVSWGRCQTFITKLNQLTGMQFRLPTEAEWEYAARGGNSSEGYKYSGSNDIGDVAWYNGNSSSKTHEVGTKNPNELGIYDMSGNVYEWCQDWYGSYSNATQTNPTGPSRGEYRVYRGGGWNGYEVNCRVSRRDHYEPSWTTSTLGLRLAL